MAKLPTLYGAPGGGSMIVELAYKIAGEPLDFVDLTWEEVGWESAKLKAINPLGQVPTLLMPDGRVMTESAAIILALNDRVPSAGLVPPAGDPKREQFLRWLMFFIGAVYPTFTYGDDAKRWLGGDEAAGKLLRAGTDEHRKMLWRTVEPQVGAPWFLGDTRSALDLYLMPMTYWRPGRDWFKAQAPNLFAIASAVEAMPEAKAVLQRNGLLKE